MKRRPIPTTLLATFAALTFGCGDGGSFSVANSAGHSSGNAGEGQAGSNERSGGTLAGKGGSATSGNSGAAQTSGDAGATHLSGGDGASGASGAASSAGTATAGSSGTAGKGGAAGRGGSDEAGGTDEAGGSGDTGGVAGSDATGGNSSGGTGGLGMGGVGEPECTPDAEICASPTELRRCNTEGYWETETNFNFNPKHCGTCEHSCLGGECNAGRCQPLVIATSESMPSGLTLDDENVYYVCSRSGLVRSVPKAGGAIPTTLATGLSWPLDIVMAAGYLYFTDLSEVYRLEPSGSSLPDTWYPGGWGENSAEIATDSGLPAVSAAQTQVIWNNDDWILSGDALAATTSGNRITVGGPGAVGAVGIDETFYYWTRLGSGNNDGYVRATNRDTSEGVVVATMAGRPIAIAIDGSYVYWASEGRDDQTTTDDPLDLIANTGAIYRSEFLGSAFTSAEVIIEGIARPWDIVVDDSHVYWTSFDPGTVSRTVKTGGGQEEVLASQQRAWYIEQDDVAVYWTVNTHPSGQVVRLAK